MGVAVRSRLRAVVASARRRLPLRTTVLDVIGAALVVAGVALVFAPAALVLAGVAVLAHSYRVAVAAPPAVAGGLDRAHRMRDAS